MSDQTTDARFLRCIIQKNVFGFRFSGFRGILIPCRLSGALNLFFRLVLCSVILLLTPEPGLSAKPGKDKVSTAAPESRSATDSDDLISIDFNNVDIALLVKFISDLTGKNFVLDQRVNGKVTIISPEKISIPEAYRVFESVLEVYGYTTVQTGSIVKIIPLTDARTKNIETMLREESGAIDDRVVTQLIPLKFADATLVSRLFSPLISKNSVMMPYPATNTLIVTDVHSNINRLLTMLKTIDIPMTGRDITIFPLQYASADQLAKMLDSIFLPGNKTQRDDAIGTDIPFRCVAEDRTNSLVVLANDDYTRRVRSLIGTLDRETPKGNERMRVIYLENARADDLVKVLQDMPGKAGEGEAAKSGRQSLLSGNVKITADKATNSLIITANKDEYTVLEDIVRQLDIPRSMVYIECLIMEVNVNKDFALGTEWVSMGTTDVSGRDAAFGGGFSGAGAYPGVGGLSPLDGTVGALPMGFSMGIFSELLDIGGIKFPGLAAIVRAYRQDKDVNILSTPQILTTDNEEAIITVGKNVPYQTKSGSTGTLESFNTYEYRDVGITLKITPQISKDRMVRLNINQEVTKLDVTSESTTRLNAERPTTFKRTIATTVLVQDQRTVVIGGLIDDSFSETEYKTPCLGDIPGLGWLFKSLSTGREKTNLFVFLTPRVLQGPAESDRIYDIKKEQMDGIRQDNVKTP